MAQCTDCPRDVGKIAEYHRPLTAEQKGANVEREPLCAIHWRQAYKDRYGTWPTP